MVETKSHNKPDERKGLSRLAEPDEPLLNIDEVADWLRIPKSSLYKLCSEGEIPVAKIGRHWRFNQGLVREWLREKSSHRKDDSG